MAHHPGPLRLGNHPSKEVESIQPHRIRQMYNKGLNNETND
jgi:hypothetical protein